MLQLGKKSHSLVIPTYGTKLNLIYRRKYNGKSEKARIAPGPSRNHYYAYFKEDDVDFEIRISNLDFPRQGRSVGVELRLFEQKLCSVVVFPREILILETFKSSGRKFHFVRPTEEKFKTVYERAALRDGVSKNLSQIEFKVAISNLSKFEILVTIPNLKTTLKSETDLNDLEELTIEVDNSTTIKQLKSMISKESGYSESNWKLSLRGRQFKEKQKNSSMKELKIKEDTILDMIPLDFSIQVKIQRGTEKKTVNLQVSIWDSIKVLKMKIEEKEKIPVIQQQLFFEDLELKEEKESSHGFLEYLRVRYSTVDSLIKLKLAETFPLKIKIIPSNKLISVKVCSRNTLQDIMYKIKEEEGIPVEVQKLYLHGSQIQSHHDTRLGKLGIHDATKTMFLVLPEEYQNQNQLSLSKLSLNPGIEFSIQMDVVDLPVYVCDAKDLILGLDLSKNIFIKTMTGETFEITVRPPDTVDNVKEKIQEKKGIPLDKQTLEFAGKQLDGWRRIFEYNIKEKSTIYVIVIQREGECCKCHMPSCTSCSSTTSKMKTLSEDLSERGAITFGEISSQIFKEVSFDRDESIEIDPFIIELRLEFIGVPLFS